MRTVKRANYLEAIAPKPRYFKAYLNLGITFTKLGKFKKAEKSFKQTTKTKSDVYMAHRNLATFLDVMLGFSVAPIRLIFRNWIHSSLSQFYIQGYCSNQFIFFEIPNGG